MKASKLDLAMAVWQEAISCVPTIVSYTTPLTKLGLLTQKELEIVLPLMITVGDYLTGLEK